MKITNIHLYHIELPLKEPFIISYASYDVIPSIIVKIHTNIGIIGFGESVPDEHVTGESPHSVMATIKHYLAPAILGEDPRNIQRIHEKMDNALVRNEAAKAAIDIACYDILGKFSNLPIYSLLGGRKKETPMIPKVLSILEPDVLAEQAKAAVHEGYTQLKMKLGIDHEKDIKRVKAVREAVGPNILIRADVNQGWKNVQLTRQMIKQLSPYHLSWIEQPIAATDVSLFQNIKENTNVPLMADESVITKQDLRTFIEHQSVDYVNIKLMKTGGIHPAYLLATQAELFGIQCQIGSMVESSIASTAGFHVALAKKNIISTEISGPTKFTIDTGNLSYDLPYVQITDKPGLGITVNEAVIKKLSLYSEKVK